MSCANSVCHAANPQNDGNNVLSGANRPDRIANAIANNTGGMGLLRSRNFTQAELADIAAYLANPGI